MDISVWPWNQFHLLVSASATATSSIIPKSCGYRFPYRTFLHRNNMTHTLGVRSQTRKKMRLSKTNNSSSRSWSKSNNIRRCTLFFCCWWWCCCRCCCCYFSLQPKIAFETIHFCRQGLFATAKHCKSCSIYSSLSLIYSHFSLTFLYCFGSFLHSHTSSSFSISVCVFSYPCGALFLDISLRCLSHSFSFPLIGVDAILVYKFFSRFALLCVSPVCFCSPCVFRLSFFLPSHRWVIRLVKYISLSNFEHVKCLHRMRLETTQSSVVFFILFARSRTNVMSCIYKFQAFPCYILCRRWIGYKMCMVGPLCIDFFFEVCFFFYLFFY